MTGTTLQDAARAAEGDLAILDAVARWHWGTANDGADCPADMIPSPETLNGWWLSRAGYPPKGSQEAADRAYACAGIVDEWARDPAHTPDETAPARSAAMAVLLCMGTQNNDRAKAAAAAYVEDDVAALDELMDGTWPRFKTRDIQKLWQLACDISQERGESLPKHPLVPIVRAWQGKPGDLSESRLIVTSVMREDRDVPPRPLLRSPALLDLATLSAVEVDGEVLATPTPGGMKRKTYRRKHPPAQGELFPGPRTLAGLAADPVIQATSQFDLAGDERNPIRGDVIAIGRIVFALTGPVVVPPELGAAFIGGKDTPANRQRWWTALEVLNAMTLRVDERTGEWRNLGAIDIHADGAASIGPPAWWIEESNAPDRRFRLAGGLFRPVLVDDATRGPGRGYWGSLGRTIDGIEAILGYSPSAGRGRQGRIPDLLRPAYGRKSGPGPEVFIPWRVVLRASGEGVPDDADPKGRHGARYRDRIDALKEAKYVAAGRKPAPAHDTIEIVRIQTGRRQRKGGLWVRATARFVEATRKAQNRKNWTRIPAINAFRSPDGDD